MMTKKYVGHFQVVTCTGDHVKDIDLDVDMDQFFKYDWADFDVANEYIGEVFDAAGIENYRCDGCYDSAYRVNFIDYDERPLTAEEAGDAGYIELLISDAAGVYIPKEFCEGYLGNDGWSGYNGTEVRDCLAGPDGEYYWDSWQSILDDARYIDPKTGNEWYIYQDGDLWAVRADIDIDWEG